MLSSTTTHHKHKNKVSCLSVCLSTDVSQASNSTIHLSASTTPTTATASHLKHGLVLVGGAAPELVVDLEGPSVVLILRERPMVSRQRQQTTKRIKASLFSCYLPARNLQMALLLLLGGGGAWLLYLRYR